MATAGTGALGRGDGLLDVEQLCSGEEMEELADWDSKEGVSTYWI